jgi:group I intron endonuclease
MNKTPGIYCITNIITNKVYIGSTVNLHRRCLAHKRDLRQNNHHSPKLQASWNKYGEAAFIFTVLVECMKDNLVELEQIFIDKFEASTKGYNVFSVAGLSVIKHKGTKPGRKHSEETKAKMSASGIGKKKKPLTEEHKEKLRQFNLGRIFSAEVREKVAASKRGKPMSEETKAKLSAYRSGLKTQPHSEETKKKISRSNLGKHFIKRKPV